MADPIPWSHRVTVADLPEEGAALELAPDADVRAGLAKHVGVLAVPALVVKVHVLPEGKGGVLVEGRLEATVRQTCVVTLEAFENAIVEPISVRFAPAGAIAGSSSMLAAGDDADAPDPLVDGAFDLGAVATEFLALAIDPYPRKPGAVFTPPESRREDSPSPFAALEKLKSGRDGKRD
jgi:uncharacterized metal-binding protein YceD (DUF177 family)